MLISKSIRIYNNGVKSIILVNKINVIESTESFLLNI